MCIPVDRGKTTRGFASKPKEEAQLYKNKYAALGRGRKSNATKKIAPNLIAQSWLDIR